MVTLLVTPAQMMCENPLSMRNLESISGSIPLGVTALKLSADYSAESFLIKLPFLVSVLWSI